MSESPTHTQIRPGHWQLPVHNLDQSVQFYRDALGMGVTQYFQNSAVFLSFDGYHHHLGLNTWSAPDATRIPPTDRHFAFLYPDRRSFIHAVKRLVDHHIPIVSAEDHGTHVSVYVNDPDGYGIELYYDRPREQWPRLSNGHVQMKRDVYDYTTLFVEL